MRTAPAVVFLCFHAASAQDLALSNPARQDVEATLAQVSADSLRAHIAGLVSFGTRHTLSSQTDPARGVGAAASWIEREFDRFGDGLVGEFVLAGDFDYSPGKQVQSRLPPRKRKCS